MWIELLIAKRDLDRTRQLVLPSRLYEAGLIEESSPCAERVLITMKWLTDEDKIDFEPLLSDKIPFVIDHGDDLGQTRGHIACDGLRWAQVFARERVIMLPFDPNINDVADGAVLEALEFLEVHERALQAMAGRQQRPERSQDDLFAGSISTALNLNRG
jgi:hypothetical protein